MEKIRISIVKYANSYPFLWGLKEGLRDDEAEITTDHPAVCASKMAEGKADIGLMPVAALPEVKDYRIISDYCIGAFKKVRTVMLLSNSNFEDIHTIWLDYRSRSSVTLARVLAAYMWKKEFRWNNTSEGFDFVNIPENHAVVLIGDQCFEYEPRFKFGLDLAEEWKKYTGFGFVFACWAANREINSCFLKKFNSALKYGLENIDKVVQAFSSSRVMNGKTLKNYLEQNIDYIFDDSKKKGMELFLGMAKSIPQQDYYYDAGSRL